VRLTHVSVALSALAFLGSVTLYLKVEELERSLSNPRASPREGVRAATDIGRETAEVASLDRSRRGIDAVASPGTAAAAEEGDGHEGRPASIEERLARLEREQKTMKAGQQIVPWRSQAFARNVDDLAQQLSLTLTQKTRIEDIVGRARQRIDDVLKIPDETGKSPFERRAEAKKKIEEAMKSPNPGGVLAFATDLISSREKKIPGRNDTYGDEINRIRKETREEISSVLDTKQRETLADTNLDGLTGEAGQVSFAYAVGDSADGGDGMIVEMGTSIVAEDHSGATEGEEEPSPPPSGTGGAGGR